MFRVRGAPMLAALLIVVSLATTDAPASADSLKPLPKCGPDRNPVPPATPTPEPPVPGDVSLELVGQLGGRLGATVAIGNHLYAAVGNQVVALSLADPEKPKPVGASPPLPEVVEGVAASGTLLLAAAGTAGLVVLDISAPTEPKLLGSLSLPGYAEDVDVAGDHAFVADGTGGLRIVDISSPANLVELGVAYDLHNIRGVDVAANHAFLAAADEGLLVANVSNPMAPAEAGSLATHGFAFGVAVSGDTAYVADAWNGLRVIDVSAPAAPGEVGRSGTTAWAMDVAINRGTAYLAAGSQGLRIFDVRNPAKPRLLGHVAMSAGHGARVFFRSGFAYVTDIFSGVRVVDVQTPARPRTVGVYAPTSTVRDISLRGRYAFLAADTLGAKAIDAGDPTDLQEVGPFPLSPDSAIAATAVGSRVFVSTVRTPGSDSTAPPSTMVGLDASDPSHLRQVSRFATNRGPTRATAVQGSILYFANESGLLIVDGSHNEPCELGFLETKEVPSGSGEAGAITVSGDYAYLGVGGGTQGGAVYVVDVTDRRNPLLLTKVPVPGEGGINATLAVGESLFALSFQRLYIFDISDPAQPIVVGSLQLPVSALAGVGFAPLAYAGGRLFVADSAAGVVAIDVSQPNAPSIAGRIRLPGRAVAVAANGGNLFVGSVNGGLSVLRWGQAYSPTALVPTTARTLAANAETQPSSSASRVSGTTCVVTTNKDAGSGSLRWCLENQSKGLVVSFDPDAFPKDDPVRIVVASELPVLSHVTLDGSGAGVTLDGGGEVDTALWLGDKVTVRGLRIENFSRSGIQMGRNNLVENNVVSGNGLYGIQACCPGSRIVGNRIGTNPEGTAPGGPQQYGITLGTGVVVGGDEPADRNLISGNLVNQIQVNGGSNNRIVGNYIATDITGTENLWPVEGEARQIAVWVVLGSPGNLIKDNVIGGSGVTVDDPGSFYNRIVGNYIGTDTTGTTPLTGAARPPGGIGFLQPFNLAQDNIVNGSVGIQSFGSIALGNRIGVGPGGQIFPGSSNALGVQGDRHVVGGRSQGAPNVLVGDIAVRLQDGARDNVLIGNLIGTDGTSTYPTQHGILIGGAGPNFLIKNSIVGSEQSAILLLAESFGNVLRANVFRDNQLGVSAEAGSEGNLMFGNVFIDNLFQAGDGGTRNVWDDGRRGNFWSDYTGQDADGDGIGDTPRGVEPNGVDRFPLMAVPP